MMPSFGLILYLVLAITVAEEESEPAFQTAGESLEMGFCFGADYIAVYRITDNGKLLLGNSSDPLFSPEPYKNRIKSTDELGLLGMQIKDIRLSDSGVYESECWVKNKIKSQHQRHLHVCDKKIHAQDILIGQSGDANIRCNISNFGKGSISIKWFGEMNHGYETKLFLDTKQSLELLQDELVGHFQVQNDGFSLHVVNVAQSKFNNFYCLVMDGEHCISFQNTHLRESINAEHVYFGLGEKAVLPCMSTHLNQKKNWRTPVGEVNATTSQNNKGSIASQMYISNLKETEDYSLVIPHVTNDHAGNYKCFSPSLQNEYSMNVCPKLLSSGIQVHVGETVTLDCSLPSFNSASFMWYRQQQPNKVDLIYDVENPPDLMDERMNISALDASLTITDFSEQDTGTYWCVVLQLDDNDEDETSDYEEFYSDEEYVCSIKQVIHLETLNNRNSPDESNTLPYAIIGGVLGVVILGLIVTGVVLRIKAKRKAGNQNWDELNKNGFQVMPLKSVYRNPEKVY